MPIDTSIYRQPQQPSLMENMGQLLALRGMQQNQAAHLQQQEAGALQLEQQKRAMSEEDAYKAALAENNGDVRAALPKIMQVAPGHGLKVAKWLEDQDAAKLNQRKSQLEIEAKNHERMGSLAAAGAGSHEAALGAIQTMAAEGLITPEEAMAAYSTPPGLLLGKMQQLSQQAMTVAQQRAEERAKIEAGYKANDEAQKAVMRPLEAKKAEQAVTGTQPMTPYQREQLKATEATQKRLEAQAAETGRHNLAVEGRLAEAAAQRTKTYLSEEQSSVTGEDFLKTLPLGRQSLIRGMASGALPAPGSSSRSDEAQKNLAYLMQFDPTFTVQRAQVRKAFTTGPEGKNIGALNTAIVHLGRLAEAGEALQNGSFVPGNEAYNWLKDRFGSEKVTNFGLLKDAVAGEMAAALKGNATDIEIEKMGRSIRAANSPAQMKGVVQEGMAVLADKARTYQERYQQQNAGDSWSPILPTAQGMLDKHKVHRTGAAGSDLSSASTDDLLRRLAK